VAEKQVIEQSSKSRSKKHYALIVISLIILGGIGSLFINNEAKNIFSKTGIPVDGNYTFEEKKELANDVIQSVWNNDLKKKTLHDLPKITMADLENGLGVQSKSRWFSTDKGKKYVVHIICYFTTPNKSLDTLSVTEACGKHYENELALRKLTSTSRGTK